MFHGCTMIRILFGLFCSALLLLGVLHQNTSSFEAPDLISATNLGYPVQSIAVGTVVVELTVSEKGLVEEVHPVREIQFVNRDSGPVCQAVAL